MPLDQVDVDKWEYDEDGRPVLPVEKEMSFLDHLEELRWHVIRALIAIVIIGIGLFIFKDWYFRRILLAPMQDDFIGYQFLCRVSDLIGAGETLCFGKPNLNIITTNFGEEFIAAIKYAFLGGLVFGFPYVFYEIWSFVRPGLYPKEQKATRLVIFICSFLFFLGVAFGHLVITPFGVNFLVNFNVPSVDNTSTLASFVAYMVMFTVPAALIFQLPVLIHFLARFGLVTAKGMRQYRRHSVIGILVISSILTPPDVVTQVLIGIPLYLLYEMSIFVALRAERRYTEEAA